MAMQLIEKIRQVTKLKNYGLSKTLREMGINVTTQGIDGYARPECRGMRLDILAGLRKTTGLSWNEIGKLIDSEFLPSESLKTNRKKGEHD